MRKRVHIALSVLLVAVVGVIAWQVLCLREPVYKGKPLSVWLKPESYNPSQAEMALEAAAFRSGTNALPALLQMLREKDAALNRQRAQAQKADEALLHIGTNALPTLLRMLRARDSALKVRLRNLAARQNIIRIEYTPAHEWNDRARHGFELLGPRAKSAVPALIGIANQNISRASKLDAIDALGFIGPPAEKAVPSLLQWATNAEDPLRCSAIFALGRIHSDPDKVVPALTNALQDLSAPVRIHALIALEHFGPDAKLAVPALVEFLKTDYTTRSGSALKAIDPEAAAKAGVK